MKKIKKLIKKHQYIIFSFILSFVILLITSKNSFLYPLNDWVDANAFFTMGKSMMNGIIPYKDLFEQKGILLYLIYGMGYLISHKTFYGVFIIEVIFFTIFLYYSYKIISLFLNKKTSYIILPILALIITTSHSFTHGGSAEEFCLPFFAITLYHYFKHFKKNQITNKELFISGLMAGCVLLIKYTLLGFWFAFMMFIFFDFIRNKKIKEAFTSCLWFLLGMASPIIIAVIYCLFTHSLKDFIDCYFTINMTAYNETDLNIIEKVTNIYEGAIKSLLSNGFIIFLSIILIPLYISKYKVSSYCKYSIIGVLLITTLGLFWGLHFYRYYILPIFSFIILALIGIFLYFNKYINKLNSFKYNYLIYILVFTFTIILSYFNANYKEMICMKKSDMFQYKYAEYISNYDNSTLLNMGYLDAGLYTTTGIMPNTRFFEVQNIPYSKFPDNLDDMKYNVENKNITFILYFTQKNLNQVKENDSYIFENYNLVFSDNQKFEEDIYNAYLFELKQ